MKNNSEHNKCVDNNSYFNFEIINWFIYQLLIKYSQVLERSNELLKSRSFYLWDNVLV